MWLKTEVLNIINELLFFANTPNYIIEGLRKNNIFNILKFSHNDEIEIINEINIYKDKLHIDNNAYAYVFILIVYLETSFNKPFIKDFDYSVFPYLKEVILIINSSSKEIIQSIVISNKQPQIIVFNN